MANNTHSKTKDDRTQEGGIVDHLWLMFEKSLNTDLTIVVRGNHQNQQALKVFRCHKLVMGRLSKLFDGAEHMSQVNLTVSDDTDPKAFLVVIRYAYTDMLMLTTVEEAIPIHKVACSCEMHQLKKDLEAFMLKTANKESVWNLLSYSHRGVNLTEWAQSCLAQETKACLQITKFLSCSQSTLQILLSLQQLEVTELELIQAVICWTQHNNKGRPLEPKSSKELLGLCLNHLRFLCLTPAEFSRHVAQSGLISKEDALMVLINLNTGDEADLPPYVCKIRTPRQESGHSDPVSRLLKENMDTESPIAAKKIKIEQEEPTVPLAWEDEARDTNKEKLNESEVFCYRRIDQKFVHLPQIFRTPKNVRMDLKISKRAALVGFKLETQFKMLRNAKATESSTYKESICIDVKGNATLTQAACYSGPANYDGHLDIRFKRPLKLEADVWYSIYFDMRCAGFYKNYVRQNLVYTKGVEVKFNRDKNCTHSANPIMAAILSFNGV